MQLALPIFQGGMGVGVSLAPLASAVAVAGGLGLVSSAGLDRIVSKRLGRKVGIYEAVRLEVEAAKARGGFAGVNIMVALQRDFVASVRAALDAGADAIVSGAGLPLSLPDISPRATPRSSLSSRPPGRWTSSAGAGNACAPAPTRSCSRGRWPAATSAFAPTRSTSKRTPWSGCCRRSKRWPWLTATSR